ncbi:thermonuclease family protein [Desertibacillus haloalkaliphilus]|uniref:thermonuclease family protein n=1 Tax=Desertibacillus haloalkaliphilus TaxID=1328930 RepID=UPI001C277EEE|nr:thermonuclease family protein [Desertibacillus haloalkaliphilus]MBU8908115.1 thermonuclease family protein [Desertibacillus haloalkaliphilus]
MRKAMIPLLLSTGLITGCANEFDPIEHATGESESEEQTEQVKDQDAESSSYSFWPVEPQLPMKEVEVSLINDGDTLTLSEETAFNSDGRVRFTGIDTPEMNYDTKEEPEPFAIEATDYTENMIHSRSLYVEYNPEHLEDMYERTLGYVWIDIEEDGVLVMLNALLVEQGLATVMAIEPNTTYAHVFESLEIEARQNQVGLWK